MSDPTRSDAQSPGAAFDDRAGAERAARRLAAAGIPEAALRLTEEPRGGFLLTVAGLSPDLREQARRILAAEASGDAAGDPAHAPREVQPGFADVRPGYVPEQTYSEGVSSSQHPEGVPEPRGRFEDQLDKLPGDEGARGTEGGRARVTIISPKEA